MRPHRHHCHDPGREASLAKTIASVYNQIPEVEAHLIYAQSITERMPQPLHASLMQNALLPAVKTAFVMRLADDDRLLPNFTRDVMGVAQLGFDVIYSWDANGVAPRVDCNAWTEQQIFDKLCTTNFIEGSAVVMRTDLVQRMRWPTNWGRGSYPSESGQIASVTSPLTPPSTSSTAVLMPTIGHIPEPCADRR